MKPSKLLPPHVQRYMLAGMLTFIPIWITWLVFEFILRQLSNVGRLPLRILSKAIQPYSPTLADALVQPWIHPMLAVILTVLAIYGLGWLATRVIGREIIAAFDALMNRIPFVQTIYGATKKLLAAIQKKPEEVKRVVLIEFPSPDMKTVGFVTRVMNDHTTGRPLAAVYVPTTPNPTSGYLEIVPLEKIVSTDWTVDEAMTFVMSGGAVAPEHMKFTRDETDAETLRAARHEPPGFDGLGKGVPIEESADERR
jgi:uncharacterized membrane protein